MLPNQVPDIITNIDVAGKPMVKKTLFLLDPKSVSGKAAIGFCSCGQQLKELITKQAKAY